VKRNRTLEDLQKLLDRVAAKAKVTGLTANWYPISIPQLGISLHNTIDPTAVAGMDTRRRRVLFGLMADAFTDLELCSIIAHELGHLVKDEPGGDPQSELDMDLYAASLGYGKASISAFRRMIRDYPDQVDEANEDTHPSFQRRIAAMEEHLAAA
jgi:Zn-dependent protease with chaperone function